MLHREDGPAIIYSDGTKKWFLKGKLHRKGGPAIEYPDGTCEWYENGCCLSIWNYSIPPKYTSYEHLLSVPLSISLNWIVLVMAMVALFVLVNYCSPSQVPYSSLEANLGDGESSKETFQLKEVQKAPRRQSSNSSTSGKSNLLKTREYDSTKREYPSRFQVKESENNNLMNTESVYPKEKTKELKFLLGKLENSDASARIEAVRALGELNAPETFPRIEVLAVHDEDPKVREVAREVLVMLKRISKMSCEERLAMGYHC